MFPVNTSEGTFMENQGPTFIKEPPPRVDFANVTGARIDCSAQGSPPPTIQWVSQEGKPIRRIPDTRETLSNGSLLFLPFHPSTYRQDVHAATYRCVASNSVGRIISRDVRVRADRYAINNSLVFRCKHPLHQETLPLHASDAQM
ncbi:hypothetical protein J437_LFUL006806 [Ladona fulva]|uniref:Ig-like domain-containing protein n=1 Tax=Ladona fulva TaxID=123851 RepID=A0A8K0K4T1_LADFU|nr:hypothetical protein J437_LFUL006806 [Ladona fulva]